MQNFISKDINHYIKTIAIITPVPSKASVAEALDAYEKFREYCQNARYVFTTFQEDEKQPDFCYAIANIRLEDIKFIADKFKVSSFRYAEHKNGGLYSFYTYKKKHEKRYELSRKKDLLINKQDVINNLLDACVQRTQELYESSSVYLNWQFYRDKSLEKDRTFKSCWEARTLLVFKKPLV